MKLKDIKDVLTYASFRPEPDDSGSAWVKRFPNKRTMLLNIGRQQVSWQLLDRKGVLGDGGVVEGDWKEVLSQMGEEWKSLTDEGWCAVSLNSRFVISLEINLTRRQGVQELLRTNPKAALGAKAERGKRYNLTHNPESNTSVLLACDEDVVAKLQAQLSDAGLHAGRICVGTYAMMQSLIDQVQEARRSQLAKDPDAKIGSVLMVAASEGSVCAMTQKEEQWLELRSRTDLYEDGDMEPVVDIIKPLMDNAGANTHVVFMGDQPSSAFVDLMNERAPEIKVSDVSQDNQLWRTLADI
jgi:hypothetical protein